MDSLQHWHLMKHDDGAVFGPIVFSQIIDWAKAAQVSPHDKISNDELSWTKAPMFEELEMDWLLQLSDDHFYGPTTLSAIQEFIKEGEIDNETLVINCKDASQTKVGALPFQTEKPASEVDIVIPHEEVESSMPTRLRALEQIVSRQQEQISSLEAALKKLSSQL